jgi:hypothetical protein
MKRIVTFLGALLLSSAALAAVVDTPSHNLLVVPRTGLVSSHAQPSSPAPAPVRQTLSERMSPVPSAAAPSPVPPTPSSIIVPAPTPQQTVISTPQPSPQSTVMPRPTPTCGTCGTRSPATSTQQPGIMCPMYCTN